MITSMFLTMHVLYCAVSNLQYLADYGPICIRNPGSIGRVGGFDVSLDADDQNFFVDPADSSDTSSGLVLLVNNLRLCNAPPQGIHFPGGIFNPDKRTLGEHKPGIL